jgi:hypothetical protein
MRRVTRIEFPRGHKVTAWKIYRETGLPGVLGGLFQIDARAPKKKWTRDERNETLEVWMLLGDKPGECRRLYETGFHCLLDWQDAVDWLEELRQGTWQSNLVLAQGTLRDLTAEGLERHCGRLMGAAVGKRIRIERVFGRKSRCALKG